MKKETLKVIGRAVVLTFAAFSSSVAVVAFDVSRHKSLDKIVAMFNSEDTTDMAFCYALVGLVSVLFCEISDVFVDLFIDDDKQTPPASGQ